MGLRRRPQGLPGGFLRRLRIPQPYPSGRDRGGVQRGGAPHGQRLRGPCPRGLRPARPSIHRCRGPGARQGLTEPRRPAFLSVTQSETEPMVYAPSRPPADAPAVRVNLYSDTQTRPSEAMKQAMMVAEVGDEQHGDDPTVHALCDRMAAMLGKEAAVFLPSGTMCNQVAILTHCRPGDEVLAHKHAHIITSEGGAPGALAGVMVTGLDGARGMFDADTLREAFRERRRHAPPQSLVEVEQTANFGGGAVWPIDQLNAVLDAADEQGLATHMDGARLMNAVTAKKLCIDVV